MARELGKGKCFDWVISKQPGEITYYMPWWWIARVGKKSKFDILFYTHCTEKLLPARKEILSMADLIITMNKPDTDELKEAGFESVFIKAGIDPRFRPEIRIGICGRPYADGRKREWIPAKLSTMMNLDKFRFVFWGQNWTDTVDDLTRLGVKCEHHNDPPFESYPKIMRQCHALLVTENVTGGPQALTEALASGVRVLTPPAGYALEFDTPDVAYYNTMEELVKLFKDMEAGITSRVKLVQERTWDRWTEDHEELLRRKLDAMSG